MKPLFKNPWPHVEHDVLDILKWKLKFGPQESSEIPTAPDLPPAFRAVSREEIAQPPDHGWRVTWLGHASFLLQGAGISLLVDPVFSDFCAPVNLPNLKRHVPPPCTIADLPTIHAVLLTHGHYDHLDLPTLRQLGTHTKLFTPAGHATFLARRGFPNVHELPWHESLEIAPSVQLTATPAQHFTARTPFDKNHAHWGGWLVEGAGRKLWHVGDSGYCPAFLEIGHRYGPIDFAMIPIGAYQPRRVMQGMHMNPAEATQAFLDSRCRRAIGMHWGTFRLTDEPLGEPPLLLARATQEHRLAPTAFTAPTTVGQQWWIE